MAKLTKLQRKAHAKACEMLQQDTLTIDERIFVLDNWHEGADHNNGAAGAHFTPNSLARDFAIDAGGGRRVIDLCAGIGSLAFWLTLDGRAAREGQRLVCVEMNPAYVEVGRKIVPEAEWITADVFDLPADLGYFDLAISNPPFGKVSRSRNAPRYHGGAFEFHVIDIASDLADRGAFIVPQGSAPFRFSGTRTYTEMSGDGVKAFTRMTGIELEPGCGIDTAYHQHEWRDVAPLCEVVLAEFDLVRARRSVSGLLAAAGVAAFAETPAQATLF